MTIAPTAIQTSSIVHGSASPSCRLCGQRGREVVAELGDGIRYIACPCGVTYPVPFPAEETLMAVYRHGYMDLKIEGHGLHLRFKEAYRQTYRRERDLTLADLGIRRDDFAKKKLLDVGCANGIFLDYLRDTGCDAFGIDVSPEMVAAAQMRDLNASTTPLAEVPGEWDVACLWDVIEHLTDPRRALVHIAALLRPGGELLIQTPCTGLISRALAASWRNFTYPQHVHLFSQLGLTAWLGRCGFDVIRWVRFGSGNTAGTIPEAAKRAADLVAKASGHGDTLAVRARKAERA